jgi:HEAT repeat protein
MVMFSTATYRTWIREHLAEPKKQRLAIRALDAYDRIENADGIAASDIILIVHAASCPFVRVWEIGVELLNRLGVRHEEARNAILNMLRDRKAAVRFQAIAMLGLSELPHPFAASLIQLGLCDRSYQVRGTAAEAACQLGFAELIADLEASLTTEQHAVARQSLEVAVALLRDGYLVQRNRGKFTNVWVREEGGGRGWIVYVPLTKEDLRAGKLDSIIARGKAVP